MKFPHQSKVLKTLTQGLSLRSISSRSGINKDRLYRLINGQVDMTITEGHKLGNALKYDFFSKEYYLDCFYQQMPKYRGNKE